MDTPGEDDDIEEGTEGLEREEDVAAKAEATMQANDGGWASVLSTPPWGLRSSYSSGLACPAEYCITPLGIMHAGACSAPSGPCINLRPSRPLWNAPA